MTGDTLFGDAEPLADGTELLDTETDKRLTVMDVALDGGHAHRGHVTAVTDDGAVRLIDYPDGFDGRYRSE